MEIHPKYNRISFNEAMEIFAASIEIRFDEIYGVDEIYDGLEIDAVIRGKYYFDCKDHYFVQVDETDLRAHRDTILSYLPKTNIEIFRYTSMCPSKIRHDALTNIPESLKFIYLEHCKGLSEDIIQLFRNNHVRCQIGLQRVVENMYDDDFLKIDDSGKYIIINNYWVSR